MDNALAERSASMRAVILDCEDAVVMSAEDADLALRSPDAARAAPRDVVDRADVEPRHISTPTY
jgi:citrate lyase beta subunit